MADNHLQRIYLLAFDHRASSMHTSRGGSSFVTEHLDREEPDFLVPGPGTAYKELLAAARETAGTTTREHADGNRHGLGQPLHRQHPHVVY